MEISQLKYFMALAETENLTRTSEKLYISAPALSAAINKLEQELGCTLFDRSTGKSLVLNARGRVLLSACTQVIDALENATRVVREMSDADSAQLNIGTASPMLFQDCFIAFRRRFPKAALYQTQLDLRSLSDLDVIRQYDYIIATPRDISGQVAKELNFEFLYCNDYPMLIVYSDHPFSKRESVDLSELKNEPFIALNKKLSSRKMFDEVFRLAGFPPKIVYEADHMVRERLILANQGIGLSTYQTMRANAKSNLVFVPIRNLKFRRQQALWWYRRRVPTELAEKFRKFAPEYYQQIDLPIFQDD